MTRMNSRDKALCWTYGLIAVAALVGTQWALVAWLGSDAGLGDLFDGPVATFATIDLFAVAVTAVVFMVVDGRRNGVPLWWLYVALVFVVAVSVAFPLYLVARTRHLADGRMVEGSA
jgi:hypothetical protein